MSDAGMPEAGMAGTGAMEGSPQPRLLCFFDAMCSWCYGFAPVMDKIASHFGNRMEYLIFTGGLRPFNRETVSDEMRDYLLGTWKRIEELTGQPFGGELMLDQDFVYDTEPASRAIVTMRHAQPGYDYSYYLTIQKAFYERGEDITREDVLAGYASVFGVTADRFQELFHSEAIKQAVLNDFGVAKQFGIQGFPTLILHRTDGQNPNALLMVGQGYAPAEDMIQRIESGLAAEV